MRRRRLLVIAAVIAAVIALAGGLAIAFYATRKPPSGKLETAVTDVTVVAPTIPEPPVRPTPTPTPGPAPEVDKRCWPMFGGGPTRDLARLDIDLGVPGKTLWARGMVGTSSIRRATATGCSTSTRTRADTCAIDARHGEGPLASRERRRTSRRRPPSPATAPDRQLEGRHGHRARRARTASVALAAADEREGRVVARRSSTTPRTSAPPTAGCSRSTRTPDTCGGRTTPAAGSTRARRSAGDRVCITTYAGSIFCLDRRTGRSSGARTSSGTAFRYESFYASPSTDGDRLYTISRVGKVVALDAANGHVIWTAQRELVGILDAGDRARSVFVGDFNGGLRAYRDDRRPGALADVRRRADPRRAPSSSATSSSSRRSRPRRTRRASRTGRSSGASAIGKYSPGIATERALLLLAERDPRRLPRHGRAEVALSERRLDGDRCQTPIPVKHGTCRLCADSPTGARPAVTRADRGRCGQPTAP